MKKSLLLAAAAVFAISASAQYHVWNFGEMFAEPSEADFIYNGNDEKPAWDMKHNVTMDGMTFYSKYEEGAEKQSVWTLDNTNKSSDDGVYSFSKRLKMGGAAGWDGAPTDEDPVGKPEAEWTPVTRIMSFEVAGPTDISIFFESASSSDLTRETILYANNAGNEVWRSTGGGPGYAKVFHYDGEAATIYIGGSGLNYYAVITSEYTEEKEKFAFYTYTALADGSENPDGLAEFGTIARTPRNSSSANEDAYEEGTVVTLTATPATNFKVSYWEDADGNNLGDQASVEVVVDGDEDITCYFEYVDPYNAVPGYLDPYTMQGGKIRNWAGESTPRGITCIPLSAGITDPVKDDFKGYPWPDAETNTAYDFPAMVAGSKGLGTFAWQVRVTEAGAYNILIAASDKGKSGVDPAGYVEVNVYAGEEPTETAAATAKKNIPVTHQDWNYFETKVDLEGNLEPGIYYVQVKVNQTDTGRNANVLYVCMGLGDNYGNWAEKNPALVEGIIADSNEENVRCYNLQGIEVAPNTKGLLILSNGKKVLNK